jgi:transcriptional regulator GlxA family with amidase domain
MPFNTHVGQADSYVHRVVREVDTFAAKSVDPWTAVRCPTRQIGIVLFEGFSLLRAGIIAEVFNKANRHAAAGPAGNPVYTVKMVSFTGGNVSCASLGRLWTDRFEASRYQSYDALFVVADSSSNQAALCESLKGRMRFGYADTVSSSPSSGRSVLGTSGLSHGFGPFGQDGPGNTEADDNYFALMASALTLVKHDLRLEVAREIGEEIIPGSGQRLSRMLSYAGATSARDKIRASARWLKENCERTISVADAVQVAAMSERNYLRRFKDEIGITPSEYLLRARLDMVCHLLIETDLPVDKIARRNGMANGDRLAKIFRKRLLISPTEYRALNRPGQDKPLVS